ncbi:MAG: hypothetical protein KDD40_02840, partial [Bdellovibrionales bacterium]|nr:hypothetical protein [Bdellovibrionales bacterium]
MRFNLKQKLKWKHFTFLMFMTVLLSFQNCADPLEINEEDTSSKYENYPFAYDTKIDSFAYMSCSGFDNSVFNNQAVFTFKTMAYNAGSGVSLNKEFIDSVGNMRMSQQEQILSEGKANRGAQLQSALRRRANLLQYYVSDTGGEGVEGIDYDNLLSPLDSENLIRPIIASKGQKMNYFSHLEGLQNRRLESYLYFNGSEALASDLRSRLDFGELIYTLNYVDADGDNPVVPMSPSDAPESEAYGVGLRMTFSKGHGLYFATGQVKAFTGKAEARVVQTINEVNLLKPGVDKTSADADWVCPSHLKFMIVKPEDNKDVFCGTRNNTALELTTGFYEDPNALPTGITQEEYNAVRAMLPIEYWHVDFAKQCVV